jgi:hypothetical protein
MTSDSPVRDARSSAPVVVLDLSRPTDAIDADLRARWPHATGLTWELETDERSGWAYSGVSILAKLQSNAPRYTLGPWGLCDSADARGKGYIRQIGPNSIRRTDGGRPAICRMSSTGLTAEMARANTRLIEAAPDLAEASRDLVAEYDRYLSLHSARLADAFHPTWQTIAKLRAAVGKVGF